MRNRHRWIVAVYALGAVVALAVACFPSFLCRAGGAILLVGLIHMIWQRQVALRQGLDAQVKLCRSALYYVPFFTGANLVWMGLPFPAEAMAKAWSNFGFLAGSIFLLSASYIYNLRTMGRRDETGSFR